MARLVSMTKHDYFTLKYTHQLQCAIDLIRIDNNFLNVVSRLSYAGTMTDDRMRWKGRFEFVFASFGYTIGLGNLWRFPQKCYSNGGGVFLIPYILCVLLCTIPTLFLEFSLGQLKSEGCIKVWKFAPLVQGVGLAIWFNLLMTVIYYNVILMYTLYYLLVSFLNIGSSLPWSMCRPEDEWSTSQCYSPKLYDMNSLTQEEIIQTKLAVMNRTCVSSLEIINGLVATDMTIDEFDATFSSCTLDYVTPEEEFWNRMVLGVHESNGFDDIGALRGRNAMMLLTMWLIIYYCCVRGIRSIAKAVYITATFPFALLLILLVRGITLEGYSRGIEFYMKADWGKLSDLKIWSNAATQAIYSIGVAYGSQINLASHNRSTNNVLRDAILIGVLNSCISIFGGFVVFSFLGHASERLDKPIDQVFDQGPGILFISYVQGISQLPGASFWSFLFFLTVFTFGLDSEFVMVWTLFDSLSDIFPIVFRKRGKLILIAACITLFLLGLPHVTEGGIHLVMLMDRYTSDFTLVICVFVEMVAVCWIYGIKLFISEIEEMIGKKSTIFWMFWQFTWMVSCPSFALFILIASAIGYTKSSYDGVEVTPGGEAIGWLLIITPVLIMVVFGGYQIWRLGGVRAALKPNESSITNFSLPKMNCFGRENNDIDNGYISPVHDAATRATDTDRTTFSYNSDRNHQDRAENGYTNNNFEMELESSPPPSPCVPPDAV